METSTTSGDVTRTNKMRRRNRRRRDDILDCPDIDNISLDSNNREASSVSPYDSGFQSSGASESSSWLIVPSQGTSERKTTTETATSQSTGTFHSQATDSGVQRSLSAVSLAGRSATNLTAIEKVATNYEKIYENSSRKTRGRPNPADKINDIPNCPQIEDMDHLRPLSLTRRVLKSENLSKLANTALLVLTETLHALCEFIRYAIRYPTLTSACLLFGGVYVFAYYLELSVVAAIQFVFSILWPMCHVSLRFVEQFFKNIGNRLAAYDDVGQAMYCDMTQTLCNQFDMCENVCSFTNLAMERFR